MRRTVTALLIFVMMFSLACCGKAENKAVPVSIDYESASVAYLGPEGTYTHEACGVFFSKKTGFIPYKTVNDTVSALTEGKCGYAVIPQENTIGGAVTDYVETLINTRGVSVVGEVELPIDQNLLALPGTTLDQIKTVYSHAQGITQGKEWLEKNLPDAEVIEVSSTAEGAKTVSEKCDKSCAAIASAACVDVYRLEMLARGIQNNDSNKTRFYVLSRQEPATVKAERMVFIASGDAKDLPGLFRGMAERKMELVAVNPRPAKTRLGEYNYLIECSGCSYEDLMKVKEKTGLEIRYLGSFDSK